MDIGHRLKTIRLTLRLSQLEMGAKIGLSKQGISKVENNKSFMTFQILSRLAVDLNINLNYLIAGIGEPFLKEHLKFEGDVKSSIMQ